MRTMILCGGLAYKTKQMAHPLTVAWGPCASQAAFAVAIWQCGLVACTSCAVPACDLVCSEFNTSLVAGQMMIVCPQAISVKLEWPCTDGILFKTHLFSNDFHSHHVLRRENILLAYQQQCPLVYSWTWCISASTASYGHFFIWSSFKLDEIDLL